MKALKLIFGIFLLVGVIFLGVGIYLGFNFSTEGMIEAKATIINIDRSCTYHYDEDDCDYETTVSYRANGREYTKVLNEYSSTYYEGKEITIHYDKNNPERIVTKMSLFLVLIFVGLGAIFALIGGIGFFAMIKNKSSRAKLKEAGNFLTIPISEVKYKSNITINGVSPYVIICNWINPADGQEYSFKSEYLFFNPNPVIDELGIKELKVYFDISKPKKHYVDVEDIKNYK